MAASRNGSEIEMKDFIKGAIAVDPEIDWEEISQVLEDPTKLEKIKKSGKEIRMMFAGKTGAGKSTLINALIGRPVAYVDAGVLDSGSTQEVVCYTENINGMKVAVYDTPGLKDGSGKDQDYLEEMYAKCKDVDLILFAVRNGDIRFVRGDPTRDTMVLFTKKFGNLIWKKVVVVITCINTIEVLNPLLRLKSQDEKKKFFLSEMTKMKDLVHKALQEEAGVPKSIVKRVRVAPTGDKLEARLLDGTLWLSNFWFECLSTIPTPKHHAAMPNTSEEEKTTANFEKPLGKQPKEAVGSLVSSGGEASTLGTVMAPAVMEGLVGAPELENCGRKITSDQQ